MIWSIKVIDYWLKRFILTQIGSSLVSINYFRNINIDCHPMTE